MVIYENDNRTERIRFNYKRPDLVMLSNARNTNLKVFNTLKNDCLNDDSKNRFIGSLLGLAVGDILGCPIEGMNRDDIRKRYGKVDTLLYPGLWKYWRIAGLHSDDTQQALATLVAFSRTNSKGLNSINEVCKELADIYIKGKEINKNASYGCWRGTGSGFRSAVDKMTKSKQNNLEYVYTSGSVSAGNGGAMRIAPLSCLLNSQKELEQYVAKITLVSHSDPLGISSAYVIAASAFILKSTPIDLSVIEFVKKLFKMVKSFEINLSSILGNSSKYLSERKENNLCSQLIQNLDKYLSSSTPIESVEKDITSLFGKNIPPLKGFGPSSVIICLVYFLKNLENPSNGMFAILNAGGDTDTTGAIIGSLYGAMKGVTAFDQYVPDLFALPMILETAYNTLNPDEKTNLSIIKEENLLTVTESNLKITLENLA